MAKLLWISSGFEEVSGSGFRVYLGFRGLGGLKFEGSGGLGVRVDIGFRRAPDGMYPDCQCSGRHVP